MSHNPTCFCLACRNTKSLLEKKTVGQSRNDKNLIYEANRQKKQNPTHIDQTSMIKVYCKTDSRMKDGIVCEIRPDIINTDQVRNHINKRSYSMRFIH